MKEITKVKKGDISVLVTILVSSILLIFLTTLSQKVSSEARIARENLMSQQAIQAAKTGLDAWKYQYIQGGVDPTSDLDKNWPNSKAYSENLKDNWVVLKVVGGVEISYRVELRSSDTIVGYGRAVRGKMQVERSFENVFNNTIPVSPN
ncbi:MAG: hypothetical protein RLZZ223_508 [Candidatus Parcubacteria bacterium]|jgi:uncharacterized membrane protein